MVINALIQRFSDKRAVQKAYYFVARVFQKADEDELEF